MSDLQRICDEFNAKYPVDTKGFLRKDDGSVIATRTRARAQVLSGHTAVIWVEGVTGCHLLDRFTPRTAPSSSGCDTCNGSGKEARHQLCRDCDENATPNTKGISE